MSYFQTWHEFICPKCNQHCFVCDGDINDITAVDVEAVRCWNCQHVFDHEGETADKDVFVGDTIMLIKQKTRKSKECKT